ncbi:MAG: hypothetical protein L0322_20355, partial [Chloroflexi bacterium]|nr:hypothetical protein [Chloroflexota bacterium]
MSEINVSFGPPAAAAQPGAKSLILRLPVSMILTAAAVVVGATVWGLIAYFTNSIFVFIPVVIGFGIAVAMTFPFKRVPWWLALA